MDSPTQPLDVPCVGDLVADIFASPVARLPQPGELTLSERIAIFPGGNALNAAIVLRRLGQQVAVAGSVGMSELLLFQTRWANTL